MQFYSYKKHHFSSLSWCLVLFLFPLLLSAQKQKFKLPNQLAEASGLYIASADSLYWLNDSGDAPVIYLTNSEGALIESFKLPIINKDWEDLTHDNLGNIYIGDFGNNRNQRRDLKIYKYNLYDQALDSIMYQYPDQQLFPPSLEQWNFNMEGFFWYKDRLHLFSKNLVGKGNDYSKHYSISANPGQQKIVLQDSIYLKNRVVTAAAISPDEQVVALLAYDYGRHLGIFPKVKVSIFLLQNFEYPNFLNGDLSVQKVRIASPIHQYEALDFLNKDEVLIGSEQVRFYGPKAKRVKIKKRQKTIAKVK